MNFLKVIYENVEKKTFISQQTYSYLRATDILVLSLRFVLSLRNSRYAYFLAGN